MPPKDTTTAIDPGLYTVQEILEHCGYDHAAITDFRTVKIDGLGFDSLDHLIRIPDTSNSITVTENGKDVSVISVNTKDAE